MLALLSPEWVAAMDRAARASATLREATRGRRLVLRYVIADAGPDRLDGYRVVLDDGEVSVEPGRGDDADVTFSCALDVAEGIATGRLSAQTAFMTGRLQVGGDVSTLLDHRAALEAVDDVFADARAQVA